MSRLGWPVLLAWVLFWSGGANLAAQPPDNGGNQGPNFPVMDLPDELEGTRVELPRGPLDLESFLTWYRQQAGLTTRDELVKTHSGPLPSRQDRTITSYRQHHRGLEVLGSGVVVVSNSEGVQRAYARTFPTLAPGEPEVTRAAALETASTALASRLGVAATELEWRKAAQCELGYWAVSSWQMQPHLTWHCMLHPMVAGADVVVGIDAVSGAIVQFRSALLHAWQPAMAMGQTVHNGGPYAFAAQQDDAPDPNHPMPFRLRSERLETYDMGAAAAPDDLTARVDYLSDTNQFMGQGHDVGVSVHWGVESAFEMMAAVLGVDPREGRDVTVPFVRAYANVPLRGAFTTPYAVDQNRAGLYFGSEEVQWVELDVAGHELAHFLMMMKNPDSIGKNSGEFSSIHESFCDIVAQVTEWFRLGVTDWIVAGKLPDYLGKHRNLADPTQSKIKLGDDPQLRHQSDVYLETSCGWIPVVEPCLESNDSCGEYFNNGVQNKWFYLLAQGGQDSNCVGTNYQVEGVDIPLALNILYETLAEAYTWSGAGYTHVRDVSLDIAAEHCGEHSTLAGSVHDAWWAVGLLPTAAVDSDNIEPPEGAAAVHPWPVTLRWDAAGEVGWQVEISTSADFSQDVATHTTTSLDPQGKGMLELNLKPDTVYYWHVRPTGADPAAACYRRMHQFTTRDLTPTPGGPSNRRTYGPWELPFHIASAEHYFEIQLYWYNERQETCIDRVFPAKSFKVDPSDPRHQVEMTVPKDSALSWRVRATSELGGGYASDWSSCTHFKTDIPQPVPLSPTGGAAVHPWPVEFRWEEIAAVSMDFYVSGQDPVPGTQGPYTWKQEQVTVHFIDKNLPVSTWLDHVDYEWGLTKVLGPHWGTESQPEPEQEYGADSTPASFFVNGSETLAEPISPDWRSSNPYCHTLGSPITFQWEAARGADSYRLYVWELNCPLRPSWLPPGTPGFACQKVAPPVLVQEFGSLSAELNGVSGPFSVPDHVGYGWYVQALTDDGMEGFPPNPTGKTNDDYFIMPTRPSLDQPALNEVVDPDDDLDFQWSSQVAHGGGFVFEIYNGSDCSNVDYGDEFLGVSNGTTAVSISSDWGEGEQYSWRVHPFIYDICPSQSLLWTPCRTFSTTPAEPPAVPQVVNVGGGTIQKMVVIFSVSEGATRYELRLTDAANNPIAGYNPKNLPVNSVLVPARNQFEDYLCSLSNCCTDLSTVDDKWFYTISVAPLSTYRYQVRACKSNHCSDYSDWAEWHEGLPWPWSITVEPNTCSQCAPNCNN